MPALYSNAPEIEMFSIVPSFESLDGIVMEVHVYVFDQLGDLLGRQAVRKGKALLALSEDELRDARILLGPSVQKGYFDAVSLDDVYRLHGYEPAWCFTPGLRSYELAPVPETVWRWWLMDVAWRRKKPNLAYGGFIIF